MNLREHFNKSLKKIKPFSPTETRGGARKNVPFNRDYERRSRNNFKKGLKVRQHRVPTWLHEQIAEIKGDYSYDDMYNAAAYLIFVDSEKDEKNILLESVLESIRREGRIRRNLKQR